MILLFLFGGLIKVKIQTFIFLLIIIITSFARQPRNERFFRILKLYQDPVYKAKDRDVFFDFGYWSHYEEDLENGTGLSSDYDDTYEFERDMDLDFGIDIKRLGGDSIRTAEFNIITGISGEYNKKSDKTENTLIDKSDISDVESKDLKVYITTNLDLSKYRTSLFSEKKREERLKRKNRQIKRNRFLGVELNIDGNADLYQNRNFYNEQLDNYYYSLYEKEVFIGRIEGNVKLKGGWGHKYPLTPVFRAFQIERVLLESGSIIHELPDETMIRIAQWLARESDYSIRYDRPEKFLYKSLDSIISIDSSITQIKMNGYSYNYVKETASIPYGFLDHGIQFYMMGNQSAALNFFHDFNDTSIYNGDFNFDWWQTPYAISFNLDISHPITSKLFLKTHLEKGFFVKSEADNGGATLELNPTTFFYDLSFYYWLNDRILLNAFAEEVEAFLIIPKHWPKLAGMSFQFFIADKVILNVGLEKRSYTYKDGFNFTPTNSDELIAIGIRYDF